ncbi:hypothetical protein PENTCL1PPCAC_13262, partial [Pristionchus entomophagus]
IISTPQCVLCEMYPTTLYGYIIHLQKHHKSNLNDNGIFLLCACGIEGRTDRSSRNHNEECDGRQF